MSWHRRSTERIATNSPIHLKRGGASATFQSGGLTKQIRVYTIAYVWLRETKCIASTRSCSLLLCHYVCSHVMPHREIKESIRIPGRRGEPGSGKTWRCRRRPRTSARSLRAAASNEHLRPVPGSVGPSSAVRSVCHRRDHCWTRRPVTRKRVSC